MHEGSDPIEGLIGIAYEAMVDPTAWQRLVEAINIHLDGAFVHLHAHDQIAHGNIGLVYTGHPDEFVRSYLDYYGQINPLTPGLFRTPPGHVVRTDQLIDPQDLAKTEYYNDWFLPQEDCSTGYGTVLLRESGRMFIAGIHLRGRDVETKGAATHDLLTRLGPHLVRAMNLRRSMGPEQAGNDIYRLSLNTIAQAVFHLDNQGRVVWMNMAAEALCNRTRRLRVDAAQKLRTGHNRLDVHIGEICQGRKNGGLPFVIDTRNEIGTLLACQVIATLQTNNPMDVFERDVCAILIVQAPGDEQDWKGVARHFGLTAAEMALSDDLVHGGTLDQYAAHRGTSIHTVRNQLRSVLAKTGTNRQSEMVGLLAPFAAPRPPKNGE